MKASEASATLCGIIKDEEPYILEWVAYHRLLGFRDIVIYDNTPAMVLTIAALALLGLITHRSRGTTTSEAPQQAAYNDAIKTCTTEWVCFLDVDEFLVLKQDECLSEYLLRFDDSVSAIAINWRLFGSSGADTYRPGLVVERFARASRQDFHVNRHVKSIVRVRDVDDMAIHVAKLKTGLCLDFWGKR